jgi:adenylate cyclase
MLRMRLTGEDEKWMANNYTANPEAYQDYLKGRYWFNKQSGEEVVNKALEYFQQAIAKDPCGSPKRCALHCNDFFYLA